MIITPSFTTDDGLTVRCLPVGTLNSGFAWYRATDGVYHGSGATPLDAIADARRERGRRAKLDAEIERSIFRIKHPVVRSRFEQALAN